MTTFAFPSGHNPQRGRQEDGMTLRDYFAAQVLGAMAVAAVKSFETSAPVAELAYMYADEMMKERDK